VKEASITRRPGWNCSEAGTGIREWDGGVSARDIGKAGAVRIPMPKRSSDSKTALGILTLPPGFSASECLANPRGPAELGEGQKTVADQRCAEVNESSWAAAPPLAPDGQARPAGVTSRPLAGALVWKYPRPRSSRTKNPRCRWGDGSVYCACAVEATVKRLRA